MTAIYYLRDKDNAPLGTVCLKKDHINNVVARGLALCSLRDNPDKSKGLEYAMGRVDAAIKNKASNEVIWRDEAKKVMEAVGVRDFLWKSDYDVKPRNEFEERLFERL